MHTHPHLLVLLPLLALCLSGTPAKSQGRFDAALLGGATFNQIDGDRSGGYSQVGFRAGVGTSYDLGTPWRLVVEIAFTQKGSHIDNGGFERRIALNYVEVPLLLAYDALGGRLRIGAGVAPAVLVGARVTDDGDQRNTPQENLYRRFDWLPFTASLRYNFTRNLGLEMRYQMSLLSVNTQTASGTYRLWQNNKGCFNRMIGIGLTYTLFAK